MGINLTMTCCEKWNEEAGRLRATVGVGLYPDSSRPAGQIEHDGKAWNVNGCCGGGCYVLQNIKFCPFCGVAVPVE